MSATKQTSSTVKALIIAAVAAAVAAGAYLANKPAEISLDSMTGTEQTHYVARCAALVLVTSSIAEAQGQLLEARQLYNAGQQLVQAATGYIDITGATELTIDYVKDRREDVQAGRMTFEAVGRGADECVKTVQKAGLV